MRIANAILPELHAGDQGVYIFNILFYYVAETWSFMKLKDFYYDLPEDLIAQHPIEQRDKSRLLCLNKLDGQISHRNFNDILDYIDDGDCLILNDSRVIPARLHGRRIDSKAEIEIFLIRPCGGLLWECMVKPGKKARKGVLIEINGLPAARIKVLENGNRIVEFSYDGDLTEKLKQLGEVPLPPYIHEKLEDKERYQTVYAKYDGSVAAPTAGLHFTPELLKKIEGKGVKIGFVTLHVGIGTFRPVKVENPEEHKMHSEFYILPQKTAELINSVKQSGKKVIAVGTTACRVLETAGKAIEKDVKFQLKEKTGETDIFIYPGFEFKVIDRLITNFHLPESTLIMLVSALAGRENVLKAYNEAVNEKYRFFSFGDAMVIY
ncbi:MAG: queA [Clostridia bacterium]|nr:queA [Clostridia bacterium]